MNIITCFLCLRFQSYLRMSQETFKYILENIESKITKNWCNKHLQPILPEVGLSVVLGISYRNIDMRVNIISYRYRNTDINIYALTHKFYGIKNLISQIPKLRREKVKNLAFLEIEIGTFFLLEKTCVI